MARAAWKFPLEITDEQTVDMPKGAKMLTAQVQPGGGDWNTFTLCVWAEVDTMEGRDEERTIYICGTGHSIPEKATRYIGTAQTGPLVWHVYEGE